MPHISAASCHVFSYGNKIIIFFKHVRRHLEKHIDKKHLYTRILAIFPDYQEV